ncbi:hypothetical protein HPB51_019509 [Rhipicephalus microplus]|uniref:Uncharacterized protein n=1 Tax=Rhipicephalus microplus TaxID=6941 RepID=A0A9J6EBG9_RHIMP|nr:hypothetical protein HPB51_019509 [Rhipicephalus microplus]
MNDSKPRSGNRSPLINPESKGGISSTWADKVKGLAMTDKTPTTRGQSSDNRRLAWADGARTEPVSVMLCDPPPEQSREIERLKKENEELREMNKNMLTELAAIKKYLGETKQTENKNTPKETPVPAPVGDGAMSAKRRAVESKLKNTEAHIEELKQTLASFADKRKLIMDGASQLTMSVGQMQSTLNDPREGLKDLSKE